MQQYNFLNAFLSSTNLTTSARKRNTLLGLQLSSSSTGNSAIFSVSLAGTLWLLCCEDNFRQVSSEVCRFLFSSRMNTAETCAWMGGVMVGNRFGWFRIGSSGGLLRACNRLHKLMVICGPAE